MPETGCRKYSPGRIPYRTSKDRTAACHSRVMHNQVTRTETTEPLPRANATSACGPFGDGQHAREPRSAECETSRYCLLCLPSPDLFKGIAVPILSCVAQESRGAPAEASNRVRKPVDSLWASRTGNVLVGQLVQEFHETTQAVAMGGDHGQCALQSNRRRPPVNRFSLFSFDRVGVARVFA